MLTVGVDDDGSCGPASTERSQSRPPLLTPGCEVQSSASGSPRKNRGSSESSTPTSRSTSAPTGPLSVSYCRCAAASSRSASSKRLTAPSECSGSW